MKNNYDLKKLKKREGVVRVDPEATKIQLSLRMDALDIIGVREEADRLGIPYQTLIGSIVHRYITGQLLDKKEMELFRVG